MDIVRSAAAGFGLCLAGVLAAVMFTNPIADALGLEFPGDLVVLNIMVLLGALAGGMVAARIHRRPYRDQPRRHLLAVLAGPGIFALIGAVGVRPGIEGEWVARAINLLLPPAAALLGMRLVERSGARAR